MEAPRFFLLLLILTSLILITNVGAFRVADEMDEDGNSSNLDGFPIPDFKGSSKSLRRLRGRYLAERELPANYTCNLYPRVCRQKNSAGPDCCHKKCVDVMIDGSNCFMCGHKCKQGEICCEGYCENILSDANNCGGCDIKCRQGEICCQGYCSNMLSDDNNCGGCDIKCKPGDHCDFGMCGYA